MPRFTQDVEVEVDVDIDPAEYVSLCSSAEIEELIDVLIEEGYLSPSVKEIPVEQMYAEKEWTAAITRLQYNRMSLSMEEIEMVEKLASRFI